jgi:hypothetical protein
MSRPRRFTIEVLCDIPDLGLRAGEVIILDRGSPMPVSCKGASVLGRFKDPAWALSVLASTVHVSRLLESPVVAVSPSYLGARATLENLCWEMQGGRSLEAETGEALRALRRAVRDALAAPDACSPPEPHAAALLGSEAYRRLAGSLRRLRGPSSR